MQGYVGLVIAALAWALAFGGTLAWLGRTVAQADARLNLGLLVAMAATAVVHGVRQHRGRAATGGAVRPAADASSAPTRLCDNPCALGLVVLASVGYAVAHALIGFHSLDAVLAGLATYGAIGLYRPRAALLDGLPLVVLVLLVLPMGGHMDAFLGFPLRLATADLVQSALHAVGYASVTRETVVMLENGAAHVDLPCSGVRSLWSGLLFFFASSFALGVRPGARWVAALVGFVLTLLSLNAARVLVLSLVVLVANAPLAARVIHGPLGILAFLGACGLALTWLRSLATRSASRVSPEAWARPLPAAAVWVAAVCFGVVALLSARADSHPRLAPEALPPGLVFAPPTAMAATAVTLSPVEREFLGANGADYSGKWRFHWRGATGAVLVVAARSWRAHHPPEQCLAGGGLALAGIGTRFVAPDFPVRVIDVEGEGSRAGYWFQSVNGKTDDHAARVFDGLRREREWLMISILFDATADWSSPDVKALHVALAAAAQSLLSAMTPIDQGVPL